MGIFLKRFLCIIVLIFLISCSAEKPSEIGRQRPSEAEIIPYSLEIIPTNVARGSIIYLIAGGFDLSDSKIKWLVNDRLTSSQVPSQFDTKEANRGDKIQAKAIIQGREILSNIINIKNSLPEISKVRILPEVFKPGDTLSVEVSGSDKDGDEVTIEYDWIKNGEPAGNGSQIETPLMRGDKVSVKITPFDGVAYGHSIILHREIVNLPPMIITDMKFNFDGKVYTYQIKATDPDGDPLTWALKTAPSGMTVEPSTGLIKWNVPPEFKGKAPITVSVTDGQGGEAVQSFVITIATEQR